MIIKLWLGLDTSGHSTCSYCPHAAVDSLGHHAVTCQHGGDVVVRHNRLRDMLADFEPTCLLQYKRVMVSKKIAISNGHLSDLSTHSCHHGGVMPSGWCGSTCSREAIDADQ